jgi:CHAT domain-containing protein
VIANSLLPRDRAPEALEAYQDLASLLRSDSKSLDLKFGGSINWALTDLVNGRPGPAIARLEIGLERSLRLVGARHYRSAEYLGALAVARLRSGDEQQAVRLFGQALPILLRDANVAEGETVDGGARLWRLRFILEGYLHLLARSRTGSQPEAATVDEAFRVAQVVAAGEVQRALGEAAARHASGTSGLKEMVESERDLSLRIASLRATVASLTSAGEERGLSASAASEELTRLLPLRAARRRELEARFPAYFQLIDPSPVGLQQTRGLLQEGEALLQIYIGTDHAWVWAVPHRGDVHFAEVAIPAAVIRRTVNTLRNELTARGEAVEDIPSFDVSLAYQLYRDLLQPVHEGWRNSRHILALANGPLAQLPLTLLVTAPVETVDERLPFAHYRRAMWLVRSHAVSSLPSVSALQALRSGSKSQRDRHPFIGFGDPWFTAEQATARQSGIPSREEIGHRGHDGRAAGSSALLRRSSVDTRRLVRADLAQLIPLPETAEELRAMARALGGDPTSDVFVGARATVQRVKRVHLEKYRTVAFATHGLVAGDLDGLTEPALALTSPSVVPGEGDGLLTMSEVLGLKLDADWVLLTACNTAAAGGAGSEAVSGLGRAFFYAGAKSLLVSHWAVYSDATNALVRQVFQRYRASPSQSRAELLRHAMLALIDGDGYRQADGRLAFSYAHPIFWAPFSLVGEAGDQGAR